MSRWVKRIAWIVGLVGVVALVAYSFRPVPMLVDVATVRRGSLRVTVDDDGRTRVRERYTISAPIQGRLLRTTLDAGDEVVAAETVVAEFVPVAPTLLDVRSRAEAGARVLRAEAAVRRSEAERSQADADFRYATSELARVRALFTRNIATPGDLDRVKRDEQRLAQVLRAAEFAVRVATFEHELAKASLAEPTAREVDESLNGGTPPPAPTRQLRIRSPIAGRVLRVFEESSRPLAAGAPILEVGNTASLELVADYLTQDAVKVRPGMRVFVAGWGGRDESGEERILEATVRTVEPGGFTKVSALGVEEQRVNVIADPGGDPSAWASLGDGFRVELRILLWEAADVLRVPTGALFRDGEEWAVFRIEGDRAFRRRVKIGRRSALHAQVLDGVRPGDRVVLYPNELLGDDQPVRAVGE